jgi:DNA-binding transcriptional ArsR family regulator
MHLIPRDRAELRMIELDKVCEAIGALDDEAGARVWAQRFSLLGDLTRLRLLLCIKAAGPISVSDLTATAGLNGDAVSQTLRFLRANQTVSAERDGRVIRYRLADPVIAELLDETGLAASAIAHARNAHRAPEPSLVGLRGPTVGPGDRRVRRTGPPH